MVEIKRKKKKKEGRRGSPVVVVVVAEGSSEERMESSSLRFSCRLLVSDEELLEPEDGRKKESQLNERRNGDASKRKR